MPPGPGSLIVTDFARGWDPTHPDEQLVGAYGAPGTNFSAAAGAPFKSPDVHDVDFWNGFLQKRNGKLALGSALAAAPVLGIFMYVFSSVVGATTRLKTALCNYQLFYAANTTWTSLTLNWVNATFAFFESLKNLLFIGSQSSSYPYIPRWWDGGVSNVPYHGMRMSPFYLQNFGGNYSFATSASVSGSVFTLAASQTASGLFRGKQIWLLKSGGPMEPAQVSSFTTSGTAGTANYYVLTITLQELPKYAGYDGVAWNGGTVATATTGGSMTIVSPQTCIRLMAVTALASGGARASEFSMDVPVGTTCSITLSNLKMAYGDGNLFSVDINNNATTWYMTQPFDPQLTPTDPASGLSQVFYKIPDNKGVTTDTSTGFNPMPNSTTTFVIKTNRVTTDVTMVADQALDSQGAMTGQVDVPYYAFAKAWQNFLVLGGDIWHQSRLWISAFGAPQVFGTQGGMDGAYIAVPNGNDGQVITAFYVWRGDLYIFKTNSVYLLQFAGQTSLSPFNLTKLQGNFGAISPNSIVETDNYLVFLSANGPCAISGLTVALMPEADDVRAKFTGASAWNTGLLSLCQAVSIPAKKQCYFQVAVSTRGDQVLVYDWARHTFWYYTGGIQESAICQDLSSSPPVSYAGDANGQVYQIDYPADESPAISFSYATPWINLGDNTAWKLLKYVWLSGTKQSSGTITADLYVDYEASPRATYSFDMTQGLFQRGLWVASNQKGRYFKIVLHNNTGGVLVAIKTMRLDWNDEGPQQ